jgi:hypothetical protein
LDVLGTPGALGAPNEIGVLEVSGCRMGGVGSTARVAPKGRKTPVKIRRRIFFIVRGFPAADVSQLGDQFAS